jgi:hypothetical protein
MNVPSLVSMVSNHLARTNPRSQPDVLRSTYLNQLSHDVVGVSLLYASGATLSRLVVTPLSATHGRGRL